MTQNTRENPITEEELGVEVAREKQWVDDGENVYPVETIAMNGQIRKADAVVVAKQLLEIAEEDE